MRPLGDMGSGRWTKKKNDDDEDSFYCVVARQVQNMARNEFRNFHFCHHAIWQHRIEWVTFRRVCDGCRQNGEKKRKYPCTARGVN